MARKHVEGRGATTVTSLETLARRTTEALFINHVWVICHVLKFPLSLFEQHHINIATELCDRVVHLKGAPRAFVRSYRFQGVVVPLLVWHSMYEQQVICMVQEVLHLRFPNIPQARVWHWQLLPSPTPIHLIAQRFNETGILPSWSGLLHYAAPRASNATVHSIPFETVRSIGGHDDPTRMHTEYSNGIMALWIGEEVFFCVELPSETNSQLTNIRLPENHRDLPPWVLNLVCQVAQASKVDEFTVIKCVDSFLDWFATTFLFIREREVASEPNGPACRASAAIH